MHDELSGLVRETVRRHGLLRPGDGVLVAVSGGPDSMALLSVLADLRGEWGLRLAVGHVHHGLRKGADTDERFVRDFCGGSGIPFLARRVEVRRSPDRSSLEEAARERRIEALTAMAARRRLGVVALGHQRDDLAETVLMRIIRGCGLEGLGAIRPLGLRGGRRWIRPLIEADRSQILAFLRARRIRFREDPTNRDLRFFRNRVRHELLPLLARGYNPDIRGAIVRLAVCAAGDHDFMAEQVEVLHGRIAHRASTHRVVLPSKALTVLHPALRRRIYRRTVAELGGDPRGVTLGHVRIIENLLGAPSTGGTVDLAKEIVVLKIPEGLEFRRTRRRDLGGGRR